MTSELITTLVTFEEPAGALVQDRCGGLDDLYTPAGSAWPAKEIGIIGQAAVFDGATTVMQAQDLRLSGTLLARDVTVAAIVRWDFDAQHTHGDVGTLISRGKGDTAVEYQTFGLELVVVDVPTRTARVQWTWQDLAGTRWVRTGAVFVAPPDADFFLVAATRRWTAVGDLELAYYVGGQLLATVPAANGDIGGGVDGTTTIGARFNAGAFTGFFAGSIDELAIANYVMAPEEIQALWFRLADHQPDGYRLIREMLPPGLPITDKPDSNAQMDLRLIGAALGFAAGQIENFRNNMQPDRAYGDVLRRWETITAQPPKVGDSLVKRRKRVVGQILMRAGVSVPGVDAATRDLLDVTDDSQIQILAFDQTIVDAFATLQQELWLFEPLASFSALNPDLRVQLAAGDYTVRTTARRVPSAVVSVDRPSGIGVFGKITPTAIPANGEVGIWLWSFQRHHALFFGLRNVAGAYTVGYELFVDGVGGGFVALAVTGLVPHWFRIQDTAKPSFTTTGTTSTYKLSWSTAGGVAESQFTSSNVVWQRRFGWAGLYARSNGAIATGLDAKWGSVKIRIASGARPYYWYAYRDPAISGSPDLVGAQSVIRRMRHANTYTAVITSKSLLCDSPTSLTDNGPMGAL